MAYLLDVLGHNIEVRLWKRCMYSLSRLPVTYPLHTNTSTHTATRANTLWLHETQCVRLAWALGRKTARHLWSSTTLWIWLHDPPRGHIDVSFAWCREIHGTVSGIITRTHPSYMYSYTSGVSRLGSSTLGNTFRTSVFGRLLNTVLRFGWEVDTSILNMLIHLNIDGRRSVYSVLDPRSLTLSLIAYVQIGSQQYPKRLKCCGCVCLTVAGLVSRYCKRRKNKCERLVR